jgi:two-component system, NarL family, nitrate/nitrite response regulator NarL
MTADQHAIRLLIVSDVRLYSEGLYSRLAQAPGFAVVGAVSDLRTLLATLENATMSIVLLDVSMPNSMDAVRTIRHRWQHVHIIGLSVPEDEDVLIPCIEAGLSGYLPRSGSVDELLRLISCVARGETFASPRIVASLFRRLSDPRVQRTGWESTALSPREFQIADLLARGLSNKQIVTQLGLRMPTVKKHVHSVLAKLQVERRAQVADRLRERRRRQSELQRTVREPAADNRVIPTLVRAGH